MLAIHFFIVLNPLHLLHGLFIQMFVNSSFSPLDICFNLPQDIFLFDFSYHSFIRLLFSSYSPDRCEFYIFLFAYKGNNVNMSILISQVFNMINLISFSRNIVMVRVIDFSYHVYLVYRLFYFKHERGLIKIIRI